MDSNISTGLSMAMENYKGHSWVQEPPYYVNVKEIGPSGHLPFSKPVDHKANPTMWTLKRYVGLPVDCRLSAPVPQKKLTSDEGKGLKGIELSTC